MSVAARIACFQLLVLGGIGEPAIIENDYDIAPATQFTTRKRGSILSAGERRNGMTTGRRGTILSSGARSTGFTTPKRGTVGGSGR